MTNDGKSTQPVLTYHIEDVPQIGQIKHQENLEGPAVTNFTQLDVSPCMFSKMNQHIPFCFQDLQHVFFYLQVDEGLIYYQHVTSPSPFWITQDYFSFHVQSPQAISQRYILNVTVTFQGPCPQLHTKLWKNTGKTYTGAHFRASLYHMSSHIYK